MNATIRQVIVTLLIFFIVFAGVNFSVQSHKIDGTSMEPSLHNGQYVLLNKLAYRFSDPARGDIIVFNPPVRSTDPYIKRVIGLPGDKIVVEDGNIYINDELFEETPSFASMPASDNCSLTVPEDRYFVLGDNRTGSNDSPNWGPNPEDKTVARDEVIGKVLLLYWPPADWGLSPSYSTNIE